MSSIIIDPKAIETLRSLSENGDDSFLREIIDIYLQDTPERLADLKRLLNGEDPAAFVRAAHTIKGSSSNIGAEEVRSLSEVIEAQAKNTTPASLSDKVTELETAFSRAKIELKKLLG